jgi:hypothetical protein
LLEPTRKVVIASPQEVKPSVVYELKIWAGEAGAAEMLNKNGRRNNQRMGVRSAS